jgi:hypothetical protein
MKKKHRGFRLVKTNDFNTYRRIVPTYYDIVQECFDYIMSKGLRSLHNNMAEVAESEDE